MAPRNESKWITACGENVFVEDGIVTHGERDGRPTYPYRRANPRIGGWILAEGLTPAALRAGMRRGTIDMM